MLKSYLEQISQRIIRDDYREESFYPALGELFKKTADELNIKNADVTQLPRKTEAGNPDIRVWDGTHKVIGYIEAKQPGENLNSIQNSEQLQRYRNTFPNVILTDFFEFRLYKNGELVDKVSIGRPFVAKKLGEIPPAENEDTFLNLMESFFSHSVPRTLRASSLAKELARRTRFLEHIIETELIQEENRQLNGFYKAFKDFLIAGLNKKEFSDLYAQTVTYGLFAARTRAKGTESFTRQNARNYIPSTIGILRDVFEFISYRELPQNIGWIVDDIAEILDAADINQILTRYYEEGKGRDPIIHFYETFLAEYSPELREKRGVYYTPEPVVSYIVRSVHQILKEEFDKPLGLADNSVTVLDPAAGTLTFIAESFKLAVEEYKNKYGEGGVPELIKDHLLEHFYAFELMMAPYAIGHLKMGFILEELGYTLADDERFKLYLTNTLEMEELEQTELPGMSSLSEESKAAGKIKKEEEVLVILGNPPYSGISTNMGDWIVEQIENYKYVDGEHFGEKKHWLHDDYVKFIRFAQWKIDQNGQGIVAYITNHSYLDNPTFRGMRWSLMESFDKINILDLHGNSLKRETAPDGSKDDPVFDIRQGVAINFSIKKDGSQSKVYRSDQYGLRSNKYEWLENNNKNSTDWVQLKPQKPFYFFKKQDYELNKVYQRFVPVNQLFPVNSVGIVTARDKFVIDFEKSPLLQRIETFRNDKFPDKYIKEIFNLRDTSSFKIKASRNKLQLDSNWKKYLTKILYRPFDERYIYYNDLVVERTLKRVMLNMLAGENLGLIARRQMIGNNISYFFIADKIISDGVIRSDNKGGESLFPLYIYPKNDTKNSDNNSNTTMMMVFEEDVEYTNRRPNIDKEFYNFLEQTYGEKPTPEQIMYYSYAVFYAPTYRQMYAEFLKSNFPRVPFTKDYDLFKELAEIGKELTELHLMKSDKLNNPIAKFQGLGSNVIAKSKKVGRNYVLEEERVYINKDRQCFEGISEEVWGYQIGGYQVLDKWLFDRRERRLSNEEIQHYCRVATALNHTIELEKEIDEIYPGVEENVVEWRK